MIHKWAADPKVSVNYFEAAVKATKDLNTKNSDVDTAMHILLKSKLPVKDKARRMEMLLANGADVNAKGKSGQGGIWWGEDEVDLLKIMLRNKVELNVASGEPVMLRAVERGNDEIFRALITHDRQLANTEWKFETEYNGVKGTYWTPLHVAAACDRMNIAKILLDNGADKKCENVYYKNGLNLLGYRSSSAITPGKITQQLGHTELMWMIYRYE